MFMIPVNILPKNVLLRCRCEHQPRRKEYDIEARICPTKNYSLKAAAARYGGRPQDAVYHSQFMPYSLMRFYIDWALLAASK